jgi:hypothetical protein
MKSLIKVYGREKSLGTAAIDGPDTEAEHFTDVLFAGLLTVLRKWTSDSSSKIKLSH